MIFCDGRAERMVRVQRVTHGGNSPAAWRRRSCGLGAAAAATKKAPSSRSTGAVVTREACSTISRRHQLVFPCAYMASGLAGRSYVQPSATDFIAWEIVKIDAERGEVTLRHGATSRSRICTYP